jgi:hypothetical protein
MGKFGPQLKQKELTSAYARAGSTFNGCLSQYFIVLSDDAQLKDPSAYQGVSHGRRPRRSSGFPHRGRGARGFSSRGTKRSLDDQDASLFQEATPQKKEKEEESVISDTDMDVTVTFSTPTATENAAMD